MTSEPLPEGLNGITGIGKDKILGLRGLRDLGLVHSDDQPIRTLMWGQITPVASILTQLNWTARRVLGSEPAPAEKRYY